MNLNNIVKRLVWKYQDKPKALVYRALLTQTGTDAPVATVLENTLGGTVVWSRSNIGYYLGTLAGAFVLDKTVFPNFPILNQSYTGIGNASNPFEFGVTIGRQDVDRIYVYTFDNTFDDAEYSTIAGTKKMFVEVLVYP